MIFLDNPTILFIWLVWSFYLLNFDTDFRKEYLAALPQPGQSRSLGMFIDSCFAHCQSGAQDSWLAEGSPSIQKTVSLYLFPTSLKKSIFLTCFAGRRTFSRQLDFNLGLGLNNSEKNDWNPLAAYLIWCIPVYLQQIGKAVGDWFFERAVSQRIDCPYPCNQTCKDNEDDWAIVSGYQLDAFFLSCRGNGD
jgi:hypothetical protein